MADKRRFTVTLPDHVADAVESRAKTLGVTPTEYAADVLRWWFGRSCPPVTHDEAALLARAMMKRVKPLPADLDARALDPKIDYVIDDDQIVQKLLFQLGVPNLFAHAAEHARARIVVVFDNHPTHWLQFDFFKGGDKPEQNGLLFTAYPKMSFNRAAIEQRLAIQAKEMEAAGPIPFSQIPMFEKQSTSNQTATKNESSS